MIRNKKLSFSEVLFDKALRHPFCFIAVISVLLMPMGMAHTANVSAAGVIIEAVIWCAAAALLFLYGKPSENKKLNIYLFASSSAVIAIFTALVFQRHSHSTMMFVPVLFGLLQLGYVLHRENKLNVERVVLLMIVLGVVVRYCYCLRYDSVSMQHDIGTFSGTQGHLSYINYWYENGLTLPDFNVTTRWQYYHPPLNHIIMAVAMKVFTILGFPLNVAQEAIQIVPMIWSALCMAAVYKLCKLINLSGAGLVLSMAFGCFYPTFIIFGGAYNNDMLAVFLMLLSMMLTIRWLQKPTLKNIMPIALSIGGGMMTKLSVWMVAPATAFVFIYVLVKNIKKPLPFIGQFAAFGAVCVPLGLWWEIRNLIKFGIPITYVPDVNLPVMSVADVSAFERIFGFGFHQFAYPYMAFTMYGAPYNESNPFFGLIKTSIFDEYRNAVSSEIAVVIVVIAALLAIIGIVALVWMLKNKDNGLNFATKVFFAVVFLTITVFYYIFCFQFPYVCTENIRYCIPLIPILAIASGFGLNHLLKKREKT